jgi:hypothetical protein
MEIKYNIMGGAYNRAYKLQFKIEFCNLAALIEAFKFLQSK